MKTISVVFTRHTDLLSRLVYYTTGFGFTHVAIGLSEGAEEFYSFNYKGFRKESFAKYERRGLCECTRCLPDVDETSYLALCRAIDENLSVIDELRYTRLGVLFCYLHIPFHWNNHYFCSQFVAEVLEKSGCFRLRKKPALYMPNPLFKELKRKAAFEKIVLNPAAI